MVRISKYSVYLFCFVGPEMTLAAAEQVLGLCYCVQDSEGDVTL